jgi:type VI secretion system protein ImpF
MAVNAPQDRLQPSLLDRLTDLEPEKGTESRDARVINLPRLREIIRRDLSWLLNCGNLESEIDVETHPNTLNSVVNFGIRDVSGDFSTVDRALRIQAAIRKAVEQFEPRIDEGTLEVVIQETDSSRASTIRFGIRAEMWAEPVPVELFLRSEVDVTTGHVDLKEER